MKSSNHKLPIYLYFAFCLGVGALFFLFAIFTLLLAWLTSLQQATVIWIAENPISLSFFSLALALISLAIFVYIVFKSRHQYVHIQIRNLKIILDENLIRDYLDVYWQKNFPAWNTPYQLDLAKHSLHINVDFPPIPLSEQKLILEKINRDFQELFGLTIGYPYDIHLSAHFEEEQHGKP